MKTQKLLLLALSMVLAGGTPLAAATQAPTVTTTPKKEGWRARGSRWMSKGRDWLGREVFNRKKLKRNAGIGSLALILTMLANARYNRKDHSTKLGHFGRASAYAADNTVGRLARLLNEDNDPFGRQRRLGEDQTDSGMVGSESEDDLPSDFQSADPNVIDMTSASPVVVSSNGTTDAWRNPFASGGRGGMPFPSKGKSTRSPRRRRRFENY